MRLEVQESWEGVSVKGPTGRVTLDLEPTDDMHDVYVGEPGSGDSDDMCKISGETYQAKDDIKELPYGSDGTEWTGEYWQVSEDMTATLCSVLVAEGWGVAIHGKSVVADEDWDELRHEIDIDSSLHSEETLHLMAGPESPMEGVSQSWAEHAAQVGRFDSAEEFVERFGLNVIEDDDAEEQFDEADEYREANVFSTE
jgi:hypothetical protein